MSLSKPSDVEKLKVKRDVKGIIKALTNKDVWIRYAAARALGEIKDPRAVGPLIAALKDKEWLMRQYAADALGQIGDARAVDPLITVLKSADDISFGSVHEAAVEALGVLKDPRAVDPLITVLKSADDISFGRVHKAAAEALGVLKDPRAVDPLIVALKDDRREVQLAAAEALGLIGDKRAEEPLIALLENNDAWLQRKAADGLDKLGWQADIKSPFSVFYWIAKVNYCKCAEIGIQAVEPLIRFINNTDQENANREFAVIVLGRIVKQAPDVSFRKQAVELFTLIFLNKSENASIRGTAASLLCETGEEHAKDLIYDTLKNCRGGSATQPFCDAAISVLANAGDPRAVELLLTHVPRDHNARRWKYQTLIDLGAVQVIGFIFEGFLDPGNWVVDKPRLEGECLAALLLDDRDFMRVTTERMVDQLDQQTFSGDWGIRSRASFYMEMFEEFKKECKSRKDMEIELLDASKGGDLEKVTSLIECGAQIDTTDKNGDTPLMHSAENGHLEIVKFLVEKGASECWRNKAGWTPLCYAAIRGRYDVVNYLLDHCANINAYCQGSSILMWVIRQQNNSLEMVKLLVDRGADINAIAANDISTLQIAYNNEEPEIAKFLEASGAK